MNKYDENYSVYFGTPSAEYPEGSAVDSTDEDKLDGTPLLAKFMNDVIGFMYAVFHGVYGNPKIPGQTVTRAISNEPENATQSDVWDAIKKFVTDNVAVVSGALSDFINTKGVANGIAPLDAGGKVAATYLPDDVLEYANKASFPTSGEEGKIYIAKDTNKSYRWSGSSYIELSSYDNATQSASGLMSAADKTKLDGIQNGATNTAAPVNADWNATSGLAQILNKPTIPAAQVNADWNATSGVAQILNKPTILAPDSSLSQASTNAVQNKIATLNMNGVLCSTAAGTQVKTVDMPGFILYAGATIKVLFQNACTVSYPQLKVGDTVAKTIMAYRGGSPVDSSGLKASSGKWRGAGSAFDEVWQPYTTLELMYDGTNWVVMGDPVIESYFTTDSGYEKKANGLLIQWGRVEGQSNVDCYTVPIIAYSNTFYSRFACTERDNAGNEGVVVSGDNMKTTSFDVITENTNRSFYWFTIGY